MRPVVFSVALALSTAGVSARAQTAPPQESVVIWPTLAPAGDQAGEATHRPTEAEAALYVRAQELDATLRDAAQDLGFVRSVRWKDLARQFRRSDHRTPRGPLFTDARPRRRDR